VRLAEANPHVHLVLNDSNAGFARACNQGIAVTDGDVLILLNNDTLVAPAWLMKLAGALRDPAVGLVGPVTNRIGNEAEVPTDHETWGEFVSAAARRARERNGERFEIRTLTMFCLAMRRDAYERIGPLDQRFEIGLLEDDDYSMRAHREGYRLLCLEDVLVHHFGESTFGKLVPTGEYGEILARNKRRYEEKWGEPWQPYERRLDPGYSELATRIRQIVDERLPGGSTVLVVSKGDEQLLELGERRARHFPEAEDGAWAGHHPTDSREAVTQLERMREAGGEFLIFPRTGFWWLEHYDGLREHLESRYDEVVHEDEVCVIFALNGRGP
jgi:glycosyltransferase involved in cell wall biosynthesis